MTLKDALAGVALIFVLTSCQSSSTSAPFSACSELGGTVGSDEFCDVRDTTSDYTIAFRFPTGYADEHAVADELKRRRTEFIDWVAKNSSPGRAAPYALDITGNAYQSGDRQHGTQSLVLEIAGDTGVHPVTTFQAFNYSLTKHSPIDFQTLFQPGSDPIPVLNPFVRQEVLKRDPTAFAAANSLTTTSYQQFAITDEAIIFFLNQDGVMPHEDGPLEVAVPRTALESMLA